MSEIIIPVSYDKQEAIPKTDIQNDLTATTSGKVLDASQGKILKDAIDTKIPTSLIANNLTTTTTGSVLDATQGKALNDAKAAKTDLTSIIVTGTTNQTGAKITAWTYFYLNGTLVRALIDIASGATFTSGTNYEAVTAGGLNALFSRFNKTIASLTVDTLSSNISSASATIGRIKDFGIISVVVTANTNISVGQDVTCKIRGLKIFGTGRGCGYSGDTIGIGYVYKGTNDPDGTCSYTMRVASSSFLNQYTLGVSIPIMLND